MTSQRITVYILYTVLVLITYHSFLVQTRMKFIVNIHIGSCILMENMQVPYSLYFLIRMK